MAFGLSPTFGVPLGVPAGGVPVSHPKNAVMRRLSKYWRDFFPPSFHGPRRYTEQALRYGTPHNKACAMTEAIDAAMPPGPFAVLEVFGGIGCNSMAFMKSARGRLVGVVEGDRDTSDMLATNLTTWAACMRQAVPPVHTLRPTITDVLTLVPRDGNVAVFFDPPWEGTHGHNPGPGGHNPGPGGPYIDPLQYDLGHGETVERCVHALLAQPNVKVVAVKVPKTEFSLAPLPVQGVTVTRYKRLKKMDLLCFNKCTAV